MVTDTLLRHWALIAAAVPAAIVVWAVFAALYRKSAGGQLNRALAAHRKTEAALKRTARRCERLERRLDRLNRRSRTVRPRVLREAEQALADQRALAKILADKREVTANHVRRVIFDEFPPQRHDALRARYLPQDVADGRPFGF